MKTSISLSKYDQDFAKRKGGTVSAGIRYCIQYVRHSEQFIGDLKKVVKEGK